MSTVSRPELRSSSRVFASMPGYAVLVQGSAAVSTKREASGGSWSCLAFGVTALVIWTPSFAQLTPEFVQPRIAPAAVGVELVAHRILLVIVLVVFLSGPELRGLDDRRDDRLLEPLELLVLSLRGLGEAL